MEPNSSKMNIAVKQGNVCITDQSPNRLASAEQYDYSPPRSVHGTLNAGGEELQDSSSGSSSLKGSCEYTAMQDDARVRRKETVWR
jgi:hypothetical protein